MQIENIEFRNFRNYTNAEIKFKKGLNIFIGDNAQGKTNITEAVYYLSALKSHRTSKSKEMILWGKDKAYIKGSVNKKYSDFLIEALISSEEKRLFKVNGVRANKASDILGVLNVVMFSPEDLKIVKEGPQVRRKFIDNELLQIKPIYHHVLSQYNHVLLQRNNLLKNIYRSPSLKVTAEVFSEQLAEYGSQVCEIRDSFIKKLSEISKEIHKGITNGKEQLEINYLCDGGLFKGKDIIKKELLSYYLNKIDEDIQKGYTLRGPHRDDLLASINGTDVKSYGSQGQQRTAALSLKLSEIEIIKIEAGEYPVLILDDVLSELDSSRQHYLLETLKSVQTLLTCTDIDNFDVSGFDDVKINRVHEGTIEKV